MAADAQLSVSQCFVIPGIAHTPRNTVHHRQAPAAAAGLLSVMETTLVTA
jgi:hypothetical protein